MSRYGWAVAMMLLAQTSFAENECYDLGDNMARWEGLRIEAVQSRDLYQKNLKGTTQKNMEGILKNWVKKGAQPGAIDQAGALQQAVNSCFVRSLALLLDHNVSPNLTLREGDSALRSATATILCDEKEANEVVKLLLQKGADTENKDILGQTALMRAALSGRGSVVATLVDHGAKLETVDCAGRTALHWAAASGEPGPTAVLVARGANLQHKDRRGATPRELTLAFCRRPLPTMRRFEEYDETYRLLTSTAPAAPQKR